MKNQKIIGLFLTTLVLVSMLAIFAQAKVVFSPLQEQYNLGDEIKQSIHVITTENFKGFFKVNLMCENASETLLFYSPVSLEANKEKVFSFTYSTNRQGNCVILAILEKEGIVKEEVKSSAFIITNKINMQLTLNKQYFLPGETLKITGDAVMANGKQFNGAASLKVEDQTYSVIVSQGSFSQNVLLSKKIAPGKQPILVSLADDKNNFGETTVNFEVGVINTGLDINLSKEIINPGEILLITASLLDQAGNVIEGNVSLSLIQLKNLAAGLQKRIFLVEDIVPSGKEISYKFPEDISPQDYYVEAKSSGFEAKKIISVPRIESINYSLINLDTGPALRIKNTGNVKYQKPFEFDLVLENIALKEVINLDLEVNEEYTYQLNKLKDPRPEGFYELIVKSDSGTSTYPEVPLTGKVSGSLNLDGAKDSLWILPLILIVGLAVLLIFTRKDFFLKTFKTKPKKTRRISKVYGFEVDHGEEKMEKPLKVSRELSKEIKKSEHPSKSAYFSSRTYSSSPKPVENREKFISNKGDSSNSQKMVLMSDLRKKQFEQKKEISASRDARMFSSKNDTLKGIFEKHASSLAAFRIVPTIVSGQKREVSVLMARITGLTALANIKNSDTFLFNELADKYFSKIIKVISQNSGVADLYENNLVVFFNVMPTANHAMAAVKTAQGIIHATNEMNQELSLKGQAFQLSASIGIHAGPVVANNIGIDKTLKYSPLAGTTSIAKALESKSFKNEIVISESIFKQVSGLNTKRTTPVMSEVGAMNSYLVRAPEEAKKDVPYWVKK